MSVFINNVRIPHYPYIVYKSITDIKEPQVKVLL